MTIKKKFVHPASAKDKHYEGVLNEIAEEKVCPLCPKTMHWHTKQILKRRNGWLITENFNAYNNTAHHLLIVSPTHKEKLGELTRRDWQSLIHLLNWAVKKFSIKGGGVAIRFGDTRWTGATVAHLHAHLIVPKITRGKVKPVSFIIG